MKLHFEIEVGHLTVAMDINIEIIEDTRSGSHSICNYSISINTVNMLLH